MSGDGGLSRRTVVTMAGATTGALLAGCFGDGEDADLSDEAWEDVTEIRLEGTSQHWTGVVPEAIDGVTNPTLVLYEGRDYEITWENGDGVGHNIQLRDDDAEVLEGTELMGERGETQTLAFTATDEMVDYVCRPHRGRMVGDLDVREE